MIEGRAITVDAKGGSVRGWYRVPMTAGIYRGSDGHHGFCRYVI